MNFEEFCRHMYQEHIIEMKPYLYGHLIKDYKDPTFDEYKTNNFNFLLSKYCSQLVQAV